MKRYLAALVAGSLFASAGVVLADSHESAEAEDNYATPVELFTCTYNEGKDAEDLAGVIEKWNAWADKQGLTDYTAWTMVPYYTGPSWGFEVAWLGSAPSAAALGKAQDTWLRTGGEVQEAYNDVISCAGHSNFAVLQFKKPPKRDNPSNIVVSFSDCNMSDGMTFSDIAPSMEEWSKYVEGQGSTAGMWVFFPAYGEGGEEFDFKWVQAWQNLEDQGIDWDRYSKEGWAKAEELFHGKLRCDASRVYLATNRRMAESNGEE